MSSNSSSKAFVKSISGSVCFLFLAFFVDATVFSSLGTSSEPMVFDAQNYIIEL